MARTTPAEELTIQDKRDVMGYLKIRGATDPDEIYYASRDLIQVNSKGMWLLQIMACIGVICFALHGLFGIFDDGILIIIAKPFLYLFQFIGTICLIAIWIRTKKNKMIKQATDDYILEIKSKSE